MSIEYFINLGQVMEAGIGPLQFGHWQTRAKAGVIIWQGCYINRNINGVLRKN
jgi:hypothetical protein